MTAEEMLLATMAAARHPTQRAALEVFTAPIYITDAKGILIYHNQACIDVAGRRPVIGQDRWCVAWKVYTLDGILVPHEESSMALAIRQRRPIRGVEAIAERPDGARLAFLDYPTPVLDEEGDLIGAVNLMLDIRSSLHARSLLAQARKCRELAAAIGEGRPTGMLLSMAEDYEARASQVATPR